MFCKEVRCTAVVYNLVMSVRFHKNIFHVLNLCSTGQVFGSAVMYNEVVLPFLSCSTNVEVYLWSGNAFNLFL